ncbi:MAG TPA: SRPBCC family protein [Candidatus Binatia bacterium]
MATILSSRHLSVHIDCPPGKVYEFVSDPENLPRWAAGLCKSIRKSDGDWIVETVQGQMKIRFASKNDFGVLDHYVTIGPGVEIHVPLRVLPNGAGSEVIFTLFRSPDMSDEKFTEDTGLVERDLKALKKALES